ncbi:MAG: ROK family protein [Christensenellales bacterium]
MKDHFIGLDIGGTKCAVVLAQVDRGISILRRISFDTRAQGGPEATISRLMQTVEEILAQSGLTIAAIAAVGISCGGPLDSRRGVILAPPNLPGWIDIPLPALIQARFHVPAFLLNDANACALVEWQLGAGRGTQDMIFLTMGTGMGGGIIAEGELLRGHTDMGGEIGHLRLSEEGPVGFGKAGSFEGFCSGGGIALQAQRLTRDLISAGTPPRWTREGHPPETLDARLMAQYARQGDADALRFFSGVGRMLGKGLALLVDAFNPEKIIIGSIFVRCEDLLRPAMEAALRAEAIPFSLQGLSVVPAQTGEALGDLASIMVALHALRIDPMREAGEREPRVLQHLEALLRRYPQLIDAREGILRAYLALRDGFAAGHKLLVAGNGGSGADSDHIVGELMKGFRLKRPLPQAQRDAVGALTDGLLPGASRLLQQGLPAISLTGHPALSTAVANDLDPLLVFSQQVMGYGRPGDLLLCVSTSGKARNLALAAGTARALGLMTLGLLGRDGGPLKGACDISILVPGDDTAAIQELHLPVYHTLCAMLEAKFFAE